MDNQIPREEGLDHSIALLKEGYNFILNRSQSMQSDIFETRILGKKAICMIGEEAAALFYDENKFQRNGAAPNRVVQTLFGKNSVQTLDGEEHRHRKEMLMSMMNPEEIEKLVEIVKMEWEHSIDQWAQMEQIVLYEEMKKLLCKAAFKWVGYPLHEDDVKVITKGIAAMFETPAVLGPTHWIGRSARNQIEKKIEGLIQEARNKQIMFSENTVLHKFAFYKDSNGNLMDGETVAVEVLNMLRPIVAIAIYMNFTVLALHNFPHEKEKLRNYSDYSQLFVQEVRRYYPFFPFVAAKVKTNFTWNGYKFEKGTLTLLDLYGTNHDPNIWGQPNEFKPERFARWKGSPFSFIPQGGGDYNNGHRCAGEWITIEVMKGSLDYLVKRLEYEIPEQDLSFNMDDIPSIPQSKIILKNVRRSLESLH